MSRPELTQIPVQRGAAAVSAEIAGAQPLALGAVDGLTSSRGLNINWVFTSKSAMKLLSFLFLLTTLSHGLAADQPAFQYNKKLGRGVNIIGYDPIWRSRDQARFQEKHFRLLREAGFNSVRINLHPFRSMDKAEPFAIAPDWLETLDWAVSRATSAGLHVILDMHEFNAMGTEPEANKAKYMSFWRQIAERCRDLPASVSFELLNEPNKNLTPALWNRYAAQALDVVRATNPGRTVIIGPGFWNSVDRLDELELPDSDRNILVTVHYYKPMEFTHQGARWTPQYVDKTGVEWAGTEKELKPIRSDFDKVQAWSKKHNRPILLGEFGAYDKGPMDSRVRYTAAVAREAEERQWSWAYWQFDSDFILWDMKTDSWVQPILGALIPPK